MPDVQLGTEPKMIHLLEKFMDHRDAVHVAVVPMRALGTVRPGDRMKVLYEGLCRTAYGTETPDGIVDPFLPENTPIRDGRFFWLLLMPGTVTGMKHHWNHPVFDKFEAERQRIGATAGEKPSEQTTQSDGSNQPVEIPEVVLEVARICGKTYDALMEDAATFDECGWHVMDNSERYKDVTAEQWIEFWKHCRKVQKPRDDEDQDETDEEKHGWAPYTCSC